MFLLRICFCVLRKSYRQKTVFKVPTTKKQILQICQTDSAGSLSLYTERFRISKFYYAHMHTSLSKNMQKS